MMVRLVLEFIFGSNYNISIYIRSSYCKYRSDELEGSSALEIQVLFTIIFTNHERIQRVLSEGVHF